MDWILQWDQNLFFWMNHDLEHPLWNMILPWLETEWHFLVPLAVVLLWLIWRGGRKEKTYVVMLTVSLFLSQAIVQIMKRMVHRPRPLHVFSNVKTHFLSERERPELEDYSFPSGHTAFFFTLATFSVGCYPYWGLALFLFGLAFLVGFSRIYLGVHYPLDVFAGAAVGVIVAYFLWCCVEKRMKKIG